MHEAIKKHKNINATLITVPGPFVRDAALEAIHAGIPLINILTENVTTQDSAIIVQAARDKNIRIVGPSSVGIMSPGEAKIGSIGSSDMQKIFTRGVVGVISKSGGMSAEISVILSRAGIGQSTVVGIGGDQIIGSDFKDLLELFQKDKRTKAVVIFGEIGGTYEEEAADFIKKSGFTKPVVAVIAGKFSETLDEGSTLGHAGAIVSKGRGSYTSKVNTLRRAGVYVARTLEDIVPALKHGMSKDIARKIFKK